MTDECPLCCAEEGMGLDIRCTGSGSKTAVFIFDEQLADQGLAKTVLMLARTIETARYYLL